jgi:hypothetical protein
MRLERVASGRLASVIVSGAAALRDRATFVRAFQPALEACLR